MDFLSFFGKSKNSSTVAKDRLKLVLMHDRMDCSPELLEMIKSDIIEVISKYVEFDKEELDIKISESSNQNTEKGAPVLYANIPISNLKNVRR